MKATPVAECIAHIAKHHGLHVDGSAPAFGNIMEAAIGGSTWGLPALEYGANGTPKLRLRIIWERFVQVFVHQLLELQR